MYDWVTVLYNRHGRNVVNQLYFNLKKKKKKKKERDISGAKF